MAFPVPKFRHHLVDPCQPLSALTGGVLLVFIAEFRLSHLGDADADDSTNNKLQLAFSSTGIKLIQSSRPPSERGPKLSLSYKSRTVSPWVSLLGLP